MNDEAPHMTVMVSVKDQSERCRSTFPEEPYASARPVLSTRRHSDMPLGASSTWHTSRRSATKKEERSGSPVSYTSAGVPCFLKEKSPKVTEQSIKRTLEASTQWHREGRRTPPDSCAGSSTVSATETECWSGHDSEMDTEALTSPEPSLNEEIISTTCVPDATNAHDDSHGSDVKSIAPNQKSGTEGKPAKPKDKEYHYGTPEMPRGKANLPHLTPDALTPRVSNPGQGHVKHLPRAEKLPLTGYELLAARLSSSNTMSKKGGHGQCQPSRPPSPGSNYSGSRYGSSEADAADIIKPIYRRFEALNHRLLLHLQDELSELEEQLHRLDTADTQTRRVLRHQNCILPASRRAEAVSGGELQWHKTDVLGKVGFKLGQYNHALSSFKAAQDLPSPDIADVEVYRTYLATKNPIAETETRFLDATDDLVLLSRHRHHHRRAGSHSSSSSESSYETRKEAYSTTTLSDEAPTPRQGPLASFLPKTARYPFPGATGVEFPPTPSLSPASSIAACSRPATSAVKEEVMPRTPAHSNTTPDDVKLACILSAASILLPVILFQVVAGLAVRLAVVLALTVVVGVLTQVLVVRGRLGQSREAYGWERRDCLRYAGVYGAVMAALATTC